MRHGKFLFWSVYEQLEIFFTFFFHLQVKLLRLHGSYQLDQLGNREVGKGNKLSMNHHIWRYSFDPLWIYK